MARRLPERPVEDRLLRRRYADRLRVSRWCPVCARCRAHSPGCGETESLRGGERHRGGLYDGCAFRRRPGVQGVAAALCRRDSRTAKAAGLAARTACGDTIRRHEDRLERRAADTAGETDFRLLRESESAAAAQGTRRG